MDDWKVRYEDFSGENATEYTSETNARKFYHKLKSEKTRKTRWAELCCYDNEKENLFVIESFERRVVELAGQYVLL